MKSLHIAIILMAVMQIPIAGAAASGTMLQELLDDFKAARALPSGTRPAPPDVDIGRLVGMKWSVVRSVLGSPIPSTTYDWECNAKKCVVFNYGADESHNGEVADAGNRLQKVSVTNGGPWALILGVTSNKVVTARWQGQK